MSRQSRPIAGRVAEGNQLRLGAFRPTFEFLEDRVVLSIAGMTPEEIAGLRLALDLNDLQHYPLEPTSVKGQMIELPTLEYTATWAVDLKDGVDPSTLSPALFPFVTRVDTMSWRSDFVVLNTTVGLDQIDEFYEMVSALGSVEDAYPLLNMAQPKFIPNDTFFFLQWWLNNAGQFGGTPGEDLNVTDVWGTTMPNLPNGITGDGVVVGISDDGLEVNHPDLNANVSLALSFDFIDLDQDPTPFPPDSHGTSVAGIVAAVTDNNLGVAGTAFNATLAGLKWLAAGGGTDALAAQALLHRLDAIDVSNNSWGPAIENIVADFGFFLSRAAIDVGAQVGRNGLGTIYVFSAGNGRTDLSNTNYNPMANSRHVVTVAALLDNGVFSFYSTPGANILVSAYGSSVPGFITTTAATDTGNLDDPISDPPLNQYTTLFNGTSAAAPMVSGVIALMLEANPNLTLRDVRYILAHTARMNNPTNPDWQINGGGLAVNHNYGFGAVDAEAAVNMALNFKTLTPEVVVDTGPIIVNQSIPDLGSVSSTVRVADSVQIETVEIILNTSGGNFDGTGFRGDLRIELIGPSGTRSVLAEPRLADFFDGYQGWVFSSNFHMDEFSAGDWTIVLTDEQALDVNVFDSWQLRFYGRDLANAGVLALDVSESMQIVASQDINFDGLITDLDDANFDGVSGTLLDLEIQRVLARQQAGQLPLQVAVIIYARTATTLDMSHLPGKQVFGNPYADNDGNGTADFVDLLRSLRVGGGGIYSDSQVDPTRTFYCPAIELIREVVASSTSVIDVVAMFSDGAGRLGDCDLTGLPRIDTTFLGPYGSVVPGNEFVIISQQTGGVSTIINSPASSTDGGFAPLGAGSTTGSVLAGTNTIDQGLITSIDVAPAPVGDNQSQAEAQFESASTPIVNAESDRRHTGSDEVDPEEEEVLAG